MLSFPELFCPRPAQLPQGNWPPSTPPQTVLSPVHPQVCAALPALSSLTVYTSSTGSLDHQHWSNGLTPERHCPTALTHLEFIARSAERSDLPPAGWFLRLARLESFVVRGPCACWCLSPADLDWLSCHSCGHWSCAQTGGATSLGAGTIRRVGWTVLRASSGSPGPWFTAARQQPETGRGRWWTLWRCGMTGPTTLR